MQENVVAYDHPPDLTTHTALFLDVDGTLVEIAAQPHEVVLAPELKSVLVQLQTALDGAMALVSGRSIADVDRLCEPLCFPVAGQHGIERRDAQGRQHVLQGCDPDFEQARNWMRHRIGLHPGLLLEDKGLSLALHYRNAPELAGQVKDWMWGIMDRLGDRYHLQEGKMVMEIKPAGMDKGRAIAAFMDEVPFCGRRPVFIGDDLTDEDGFAMINQLKGHSLKVGPGPTAACFRLSTPAAVASWLYRQGQRLQAAQVS
jgi:trehalose 6-phosphate phosphatase